MAKRIAPSLREEMAQDVATAEPSKLDVNRVRHCIDALEHLDGDIAAVEARLSLLTKQRRELAEVTIPTLFDEAGGVERIALDDGRTISLQKEVHPNVLVENQPKLFAWLKTNKLDSIIKNEVKSAFGRGEDALAAKAAKYLKELGVEVKQKRFIHPQTFKAFVKERVDKGAVLPDVVDINEVRTTKITVKGK